jgi:hypothetical protein
MSTKINRFLYAGFVVLALYYLFQRDAGTAMANLGIALAFDPFDQKQPWKERPLWQRIWLYTHLALMAGILGLWVGWNDALQDMSAGYQDAMNEA